MYYRIISEAKVAGKWFVRHNEIFSAETDLEYEMLLGYVSDLVHDYHYRVSINVDDPYEGEQIHELLSSA